jgi:universal stress protein A
MAEDEATRNEAPAIRRVLVAVDPEPESAYAAEYALLLAQALKAEIIFASVAEASGFDEPAYHATSPVPESLVEQTAQSDTIEAGPETLQRDLVESWKTAAMSRGIPSHGVFDYGGAVEALVQIATVQHADLIVAGTHGRRGISRFFHGSVAESLLRQAPCPVLAVRHPGA